MVEDSERTYRLPYSGVLSPALHLVSIDASSSPRDRTDYLREEGGKERKTN
jgi:hypothetical protein